MSEFGIIIRTDAIKLPEERVEEVMSTIFECLKQIYAIEGLLLEYFNKLNSINQILCEGKGYSSENGHITDFDDPTIILHKIFKEYLIACCIALKYRTKLATIILNDKELIDHDKLRKKVISYLHKNRKKLGDDYYNSSKTMLAEDKGWFVELTNFRNQAEHVENHTLELSDFELYFKGNELFMKLPELKEINKPLHLYMAETFYNVYTYIEDFTALLLNLCCADGLMIGKTQNPDHIPHEAICNDIGNQIYILTITKSVYESMSL